MNCSRMQTLCPAKWDMLQARPPPPGHTPACTDTLWCLWIPDSTHSSGPHASLGCISWGGTYTTLSTWDCVFLSVFRLFMLISAISFAWNKAKCLVGFTVHSQLSVSTCLLSLMRDGLWWAIMTKMQGRPPHCLIADSTVTGMKHIWVFYRLKRKYISTNFSHITIFCFISSVEYLTTAVLTSSSLQCFWFSALFLIFLHIIFPSQHLDSNTDTEKVLSNIQEKKNNNNPPKPWHLAPTFTTTTSTANVK